MRQSRLAEGRSDLLQGYITIFPLALGLLKADSPHFKALLDLIHDPEHLWSPYGILSLSKADPYFGQGENYWRGPIWMQVNYMVLQSLHTVCRFSIYIDLAERIQFYIHQPGPYQEQAAQVYSELRENLINNVYKVCSPSSLKLQDSQLISAAGLQADWNFLGAVQSSYRSGTEE